ncbi:NAD-dependent epimerase/dehydratase family protein [Flavihumibacter petaseus]|uniref:NAD-dependent epimerase/dehydratase domain-containing protein n=1 Tax=Flavihumibacter petaseus NBRC 106054 TaxID=1220578 RepID=A0A0E9N1D3_9BACT|nr:NAD-dependent epimerase/dehydratase family protein [Flavihumibacter petaseus]GAO43568.1 hypothetical protein FPE01S_02_06730 [Flavihumibacter petaseus NBRC 106054]
MKVIITGTTGMVGEGVLLVCLEHPAVTDVLVINRRPLNRQHPRLKELLLADFTRLESVSEQVKGYDACFFCAGVSSVGMDEAKYHALTYDLTLTFAGKLASLQPEMVFTYVSGKHTDSSEKGRTMWARVKGKTENALQRLPFKATYNFRPGLMKPVPGQQNVKSVFRVFLTLYPLFALISPGFTCTLQEVGLAMIHAVSKGYHSPILEVPDIKELAR